jgi:hypothetical protein
MQLRKDIFNLRIALFSEVNPAMGADLIKRFLEDFDAIKREYFFSLAVGIKMSRAMLGQPANLDSTQLWKRAQANHFTTWNNFILSNIPKLPGGGTPSENVVSAVLDEARAQFGADAAGTPDMAPSSSSSSAIPMGMPRTGSGSAQTSPISQSVPNGGGFVRRPPSNTIRQV